MYTIASTKKPPGLPEGFQFVVVGGLLAAVQFILPSLQFVPLASSGQFGLLGPGARVVGGESGTCFGEDLLETLNGGAGQLSEAVGAKGHGTSHHCQSGNDPIHIDYIQNAESLGAKGIHIISVPQFKEVILETMNYEGVLFLYCKVAKSELVENGAWWDVPIATTSRDSQTRNLRQQYDLNKKNQKNYIRPIDGQQN